MASVSSRRVGLGLKSAMLIFSLSCWVIVLGGCPQNGDGTSTGGCTGDPVNGVPEDGSTSGQDSPSSSPPPPATALRVEGNFTIATLNESNPRIFAVRGSRTDQQVLLAGQINPYRLQCQISDTLNMRFVTVDLSACGGPASADLTYDDANKLWFWANNLIPTGPGPCSCVLTAENTDGKRSSLTLILMVNGPGSQEPIAFDVTRFVTCLVEPTTTDNAGLSITHDGASVFGGALSYPAGYQFVPAFKSGVNVLSFRGTSASTACRIRFLQGLDPDNLTTLFDAVTILIQNQTINFNLRYSPALQQLQPVTVTNPNVTLKLRDFAAQDNDRIDLYFNGQRIRQNLTILNAPTDVPVQLIAGQNRIRIVALNEGTSSPNTAEIRIDPPPSSGPAAQQWGLLTNEEAQLIITR